MRTIPDDVTKAMEADVRQMAQTLAPQMPKATGMRPVITGAPSEREGPIGATAVAKRIESLMTRTQELGTIAEAIATALSGQVNDSKAGGGERLTTGDHLFGRQMAGLDELGFLLDSLGRSLDRAARALS